MHMAAEAGGGGGAPSPPRGSAGSGCRPGCCQAEAAQEDTPAEDWPASSGRLRIRPLSGQGDGEAEPFALLPLGTELQNPQGLSGGHLASCPTPSRPWVCREGW